MARTGTELLLDFIVEQGLPLEKYDDLVKPIADKFDVSVRNFDTPNVQQQDAPKMLIELVIRWESHIPTYDYTSLQTRIDEVFIIKTK